MQQQSISHNNKQHWAQDHTIISALRIVEIWLTEQNAWNPRRNPFLWLPVKYSHISLSGITLQGSQIFDYTYTGKKSALDSSFVHNNALASANGMEFFADKQKMQDEGVFQAPLLWEAACNSEILFEQGLFLNFEPGAGWDNNLITLVLVTTTIVNNAANANQWRFLMKNPDPPETVQPAISGLVDFPVGFCGVSVIKGVCDLPWKLLIAADANDNLPIGFHAPKHRACHFSLHSKAVKVIAAQHLCTMCCHVCLPTMPTCPSHAWAE